MSRAALLGSGLLWVWTLPWAAAVPAADWRHPWVAPRDSHLADVDSDEYAWRLFVALNWPADLRTRSANPATPLGTPGPSVWETWQIAAEVFLEDGRDPGPWMTGPMTPSVASDAADVRRFEILSLKDLPNARHIVGGRMMPLVDPVANAKRLTEIRFNQASFEYIRAHQLYNVEGQLQAVADGEVHFPVGAMQVKAKWRRIRAEERDRYHAVEVRLTDGSIRLYGLTALHVASKDLPQWFWATFEQVDNGGIAHGEGWRLPSSDRFACGQASPACNRAPSGIGLEGTVWQHYRLRGTLTRFVDARRRPLLLANSELENGMQTTSSCITCHARAAIGNVGGVPRHLPIFRDAEMRRGYVGKPRAEWFLGGIDGTTPVYRPLDFVWSLSQAKPRGGSL